MPVFRHPMISPDVIVVLGKERDAQVWRWRAVKERIARENEINRLRFGVIRKGSDRVNAGCQYFVGGPVDLRRAGVNRNATCQPRRQRVRRIHNDDIGLAVDGAEVPDSYLAGWIFDRTAGTAFR